ncbi:dihydrofolate reductase family protein [Leucobacter sp.]
MGSLIYSMLLSADGYAVDAEGDFSWGAVDEELHRFAAELGESVGTYLYGRRMYETMVYWETADAEPGQPEFIADYAREWRERDKIVFSTTLDRPRSARTTIRRAFDPDEILALKRDLDHDLTVDGPTLASQALRAGLVDEIHLLMAPVIVGGGLRFFPDGLRAELELLEQRAFGGGTAFLRYRVGGRPG